MAAAGRNALKTLMDAELEQSVRDSMKTLPPKQRTVFALRYLEGFSLEEIAQSLDLSVGAVKAHLWHAAAKMKKKLTACGISLEE